MRIASDGPEQNVYVTVLTNVLKSLTWAERGSNPRPRDYESPALTAELPARLDRIRISMASVFQFENIYWLFASLRLLIYR